jgi:hypothetical protein
MTILKNEVALLPFEATLCCLKNMPGEMGNRNGSAWLPYVPAIL